MTPTAAPIASARDLTGVASRMRMVVMRLARRVRQEALGGDVSFSMLTALATVERRGAVTLGELAAAERVQPPSMTKIVARLEELGLVVREVDPDDRRVARVHATRDGRRLVERSRSRGSAYIAGRLATLAPEERAVVEAALPVLERLLEHDE
ncbi:MAG: MarR family transcriptional regulator [Actinobacteria bacterium]|nr:MarR family transcriptional regulator [Actinomycetota bacterium]